jgi:biopolymer transport protein ExbD
MGASVEQDEDIIAGINITPMVDIMLVLLIIFMLTASVIEDRSIKVELPEATTAGETESTVLTLVIDSEGTWYLDGVVTSPEQVRAFIQRELEVTTDIQAVIAADKAVPYGEVISVIDLVKQEGVIQFALNTDPASANIPAAGSTPPQEKEQE